MARMRRLLRVDVENRLAVVETGIVNAQVSRAVAAHGLYYAPDPSSGASCTVGGNVAENAGGIHCLKYGVTTDHVVGARVVLSDGEIVELGAGGAGDNVGFDLLGAFVGSEGTFGIATEATIKLLPLPQSVRTLLADFTDINDASRAVSAIIAAGLVPAALEMVDGATIRAVEASAFAAGLPIDAQAALLIELDGLEAGLDDEATKAETICREHGARGVRRAMDERERKKLWAARKGAFGAMGRLAPDMMLQDAVVPRSRLPEVLAETYRISAKYNLLLANVFHAGDGNLHPILCFDRRNADELRRVEGANREIVETCIRAGGTLTGEHGVGLDKSKYMPLLFSADTLDAMLRVRAAFDPSGLCNPGKIIPTPRGCGEARAVASSKGDTNADSRTRSSLDETDATLRSEARNARLSSIHAASLSSVRDAPASLRPVSDRVRCELERITLTEVDESQPERLIVSPASTEEAAELLRVAARESIAVVPAGARMWLDAESLPRSCLVVSTRRLARIVAHEPADLVATVEAGVPHSHLNEELSRAGQWLPLDPPDDGRATVGGVVATNATGAQSFAYGAPRASVLGMTVVLADGRVIKIGGCVVKNVAGYDLSKLFAGSYGALGVITEITFKLRPRPARAVTIIAHASNREDAFAAARRVIAGQFLPVAIELRGAHVAASPALSSSDAASRDARESICSHGTSLLVRFAGSAQSVASQLERARALLTSSDAISNVEVVEDDARLWQTQVTLQSPPSGAHQLSLRLGALPSRLPEVLNGLEASLGDSGEIEEWRANADAGRLRVALNPIFNLTGCVDAVARLRRELQATGGSLVVEGATDEMRREMSRINFDAWGIDAARVRLMRRVKDNLDPQGLLSPGRFFA
jgi:glycolate oxidase subunit GlcD